MKKFVGIDFAKEKFDVVMISSEYVKDHSCEHDVFDNSKEGYERLLKWVKARSPKTSSENVVFCGEDTGVYSRPASEFLTNKGYKVCLENAYRIKMSSGLMRGKNDRQDALMIAEYAMRHEDKLEAYAGQNPSLKTLDILFKQRRLVVKQSTELKGKLESLMFGRGDKESLIATLDKYCVIKEGGISLKTDKLAKLNLGDMAIVQSLATLKIYDWQLSELDRQLKEAVKQDDGIRENFDIITSIPGIAMQNAVALLVYTDNFKQFGYDARKLASFYGVAVFGKESGSSVYSSPHTSHLANKQLKSLLTQAALIAIVHCEPLRTYYNRLLLKGKKKPVVLNNVKNKLLHMVMAMVRNKTKYDAEAYGKSANLHNTQMTPEFF